MLDSLKSNNIFVYYFLFLLILCLIYFVHHVNNLIDY